MSTIQQRILQYIDLKGITPYRFCKDLGLSMGYLDKKGAIGTDKYLKIIEYYSEINPDWLLSGKGEMLRNSEEKMEEPNSTDKKLIASLEKNVMYLEKELEDCKSEKKLLENSKSHI